MGGAHKLFGAPIQLLRPSQGLNRSQWRLVQRQWQRHLSSQTRRPTSYTSPSFRTTQRYASTAATDVRSAGTRSKNLLLGTGIIFVLTFGYLYVSDTRASIHQWLIVPSMRLFHYDAEDAHHAGVNYLKGLYSFGLNPRERGNDDQVLRDLQVEIFGHVLDNPIGTSAGIDKDAEVPDALMALGPAIVEVGGVTPLPQEGNPKPRVFRLPSQNALINRYGLNSEGADHVAVQLRQRVREFAYTHGLGLDPESERIVLDGEAGVPPGSLVPGKLLAVQVAKNKNTPDNDITAVARDYTICVEKLAKYADILVVNVSSPNTPGLRDLQATGPLTAILSGVVGAAKSVDRKTKPAVMVKVSPDEDSDAQVEGICTAVWASGVDGIIVGNTTKKRPDTIPTGFVLPAHEEKLLTEMGGYSGPQMFERTLALVKKYRVKLDQGPPDDASSSSSQKPASTKRIKDAPTTAPSHPTPESVDASIARDVQKLKPMTAEAEEASKQPLIKLPQQQAFETANPFPTSTDSTTSSGSIISSPVSSKDDQKVIFATGGITNGKQCLEILNAGASVCQVYTAMMYGGVGTVTRMKREMREEMAKK